MVGIIIQFFLKLFQYFKKAIFNKKDMHIFYLESTPTPLIYGDGKGYKTGKGSLGFCPKYVKNKIAQRRRKNEAAKVARKITRHYK